MSALFKKKKESFSCANCPEKFDSIELRDKHFKDAHENPEELVPIGQDQPKPVVELESVIANNPDAWFKARVLELLAGMNDKLEIIVEANDESDKESKVVGK